jgi:hypothetical protein
MQYIISIGVGKTRAKAFEQMKERFNYTGKETKFFFLEKDKKRQIPIDLTRFVLFARGGYFAKDERELTTTEKKYMELAEELFGEDFFKHNIYCFRSKINYCFLY